MLDTGYWILDARDAGYWLLDAGKKSRFRPSQPLAIKAASARSSSIYKIDRIPRQCSTQYPVTGTQ